MSGLLAALLILPIVAHGACTTTPMPAVAAALGPHPNGVAAIMDDRFVSDYDLAQSVALHIMLDDDQRPDVARLGRDTLRQLKIESTWMAKAFAHNVRVEPAEVDAAIAHLLARDHVTAAELNARLAQGGIDLATLRGRIAVAIAHAKARHTKASLPFRIAQRHCG